MKVEVYKCDGCKKELVGKDRYKMKLETDRFWDGVDMDTRSINLDFCEQCAKRIKQVLEKIDT